MQVEFNVHRSRDELDSLIIHKQIDKTKYLQDKILMISSWIFEKVFYILLHSFYDNKCLNIVVSSINWLLYKGFFCVVLAALRHALRRQNFVIYSSSLFHSSSHLFFPGLKSFLQIPGDGICSRRKNRMKQNLPSYSHFSVFVQ